jgi:copper chaperone CopZ
MKQIFILLLTILTATLQAADEAKHTFEGEVTGVVCQACSDHVKAALGKLPGVSSVTIKRGEKPGAHKLTIVSTADKLTKEEANKALGEHAKSYAVISLEPAKP